MEVCVGGEGGGGQKEDHCGRELGDRLDALRGKRALPEGTAGLTLKPEEALRVRGAGGVAVIDSLDVSMQGGQDVRVLGVGLDKEVTKLEQRTRGGPGGGGQIYKLND